MRASTRLSGFASASALAALLAIETGEPHAQDRRAPDPGQLDWLRSMNLRSDVRAPGELGRGSAIYTDVRVFGVATSEQIKKPPPRAAHP